MQSYKLYEVGGKVRDELLGLQSKDIDYTVVLSDTSITPQEGFKWFCNTIESEGFQIFVKTPEMFTVRAKFPKNHKHSGDADFVLARKEVGYIPGTRRPILELGSLEDDLIRRDFTLNAIAKDEDGNFIDPFSGREALDRRMLITPTDPEVTMLDDPLRLLRAMRFVITKGFEFEYSLWMSFKNPKVLRKLGQVVSQERIREELTKMFKHDTLKTLRMMEDMDNHSPGFMETIFKDGLWLMPTTKQ